MNQKELDRIGLLLNCKGTGKPGPCKTRTPKQRAKANREAYSGPMAPKAKKRLGGSIKAAAKANREAYSGPMMPGE